MAERDTSLGSLLGEHLRESFFRDIRVAFPAEVKSYDASTQTADLLPLISEFFEEEDGTVTQLALPVVAGAKVLFPGAGGYRMTFPVAAGDTGMCIVADRSLDAWLAQGGRQQPADKRRHHLTDAVFVPGLKPNNAPWTGAATDGLTVGKDGGPQVKVKTATIELGGSAQSALRGDAFNSGLSSLLTALNTFALANTLTGGGALSTAVGVFQGLLSGYLSSTVKLP